MMITLINCRWEQSTQSTNEILGEKCECVYPWNVVGEDVSVGWCVTFHENI